MAAFTGFPMTLAQWWHWIVSAVNRGADRRPSVSPEAASVVTARSAAGQLGTKAAATAPSDGGTQEASEPVSNPRPESRRQRDRHHS